MIRTPIVYVLSYICELYYFLNKILEIVLLGSALNDFCTLASLFSYFQLLCLSIIRKVCINIYCKTDAQSFSSCCRFLCITKRANLSTNKYCCCCCFNDEHSFFPHRTFCTRQFSSVFSSRQFFQHYGLKFFNCERRKNRKMLLKRIL